MSELDQLESLQRENRALKSERDALAAQVAGIREALKACCVALREYSRLHPADSTFEKAHLAINAATELVMAPPTAWEKKAGLMAELVDAARNLVESLERNPNVLASAWGKEDKDAEPVRRILAALSDGTGGAGMITEGDRIAKLEALYARIPKMKNCQGKCEDSCTVIPCTPFEKKRIEAAMGKPFVPVGVPPARVRCSALTADGKCSQYEKRPAICRAFGTVSHPFMRCDYGCEPERWMSGKELFALLMEIEALCGGMQTPDVPGWPRLTDAQANQAALDLLR